MLRKVVVPVLLTALLSLAFTATTSAQSTCTGTPVTLRVDDWSSGDRVEYMNQVIDAFMKENPCITVKTEPNTSDDANTRRLTQILAGTAPDLIATGESWIPLYAEAGAFTDLTKFIKGPIGYDPAKEFIEAVYNQGFYKGVPYALAKDYSTSAFTINKGMFDKAGIAAPKEGWNWNDVLDDAMTLTIDKNGNNANSPDFDPANIVQYGIDIINDGWWRGYQSYLYSWDAHTMSKDGSTTQGYLNSDNAVKAWQFYADLVHKYHVAPTANILGSVEGGREQMFADGKIAIGITFHGPWWQDVFNKVPNLQWAAAPLPVGPNGTHESAVMWMGWGINAKTQHPEEAWKLLSYLTGEPGERVFALKALSPVQSVTAEMQRTTDPYWGVYVNEATHLGQLDEQLNPYYNSCITTPAGDLLTRVLSDGGESIDIKAELTALSVKADACLAEAAQGGVQAVAGTPEPTAEATSAS